MLLTHTCTVGLFSPWRFLTDGGHPSLRSSAAAAPAAWTPRLPQPPAGPAAAPACRLAPRPPAHQDRTTAVLTPRRIYCTTGIKVKNVIRVTGVTLLERSGHNCTFLLDLGKHCNFPKECFKLNLGLTELVCLLFRVVSTLEIFLDPTLLKAVFCK